MTDKSTLLIVDDDYAFAKFVENIAVDSGFKVITTDDPTEFAALYSDKIDIVVLDLFMPKIDGVELLRFLADNHSSASVIFMSGKDSHVLHSVRELANERGVNVLASFQKPFHVVDFEAALKKYKPMKSRSARASIEKPSTSELRQAINNKELFLVYQPQISLTDRSVIGFESLVRWKHPTKGMIPPGIFIPFAEENGLIADITTFTTESAIRQQGIWKSQGHNYRVSLNMSPKLLDNLDMPENLESYALKVGADIPKIIIEVTETALMSDVVRYMDILTRLRMKGFNLSIDDFGTGYSSLQQLIRIPFTELKIDRAFIRNLDTNKECKMVAEMSILLAHKLDMSVVSEGIETEAVWNILKELGCDKGQGFWMGKPMLAEDIDAWTKSWQAG